MRFFDIIRLLREALILAYSTASSGAVLPRLIEKMQSFGVPKYIVGFVIPRGYWLNLAGSTTLPVDSLEVGRKLLIINVVHFQRKGLGHGSN